MRRGDLRRLSRLRIHEARILLRAGGFQGAYYLAGYAVESALKACIAQQFQRHDIPDRKLVNDVYTHDMDKLLDLAGPGRHSGKTPPRIRRYRPTGTS
jgi:HEPN domain-containing protein